VTTVSATVVDLDAALPVSDTDATKQPGQAPASSEDNVRRRQLLAGIVGAGITPAALTALDDARRAMDQALDGEHHTSDIAYWEQATERYGYGYQGQAPFAVLSDLVADFSDVQRALRHGMRVTNRLRLCRTTAQLGGMIGIVLHDLGRRRDAHAWFRTAGTAAAETGDRPLQAWLLAREAMIPLNYGAPQAAASLTARARELSRKSRTAPAALTCAVEARAQAALGRHVPLAHQRPPIWELLPGRRQPDVA
jgi:hypothetical protein